MDYFMFNGIDSNNNKEPKKIDKKKIIIIVSIILSVVIIVSMISAYMTNKAFRAFFDKYIFRKEVYENNLATININPEDNPHVYVYSKYIAVLNKNVLQLYNSGARLEHSLDVSITTPLFASNGKYLAIAENKGKDLYLISDHNIAWQKTVDGDISSISVNENGYVAIAISNTTYKTVIITFDTEGKQLFTMFMANTYAIDTSISGDNKYLAIAEANFSGTLIQSNVKIVSIEKAQANKSEYIEYNYIANSNDLIINIEYQDRNKLVCLYDSSVHVIQDNADTELMKLDKNNVLFVDVNLKSNIARVIKTSDAILNSNSELNFTNTTTNSVSTYDLGGIPKSIQSYGDITVANLGTEALFIKSNGWLCKKYNSGQEIKEIVLGQNIAGIVYKKKIEIIDL